MSTTLLSMVFHDGALWALPQLPAPQAAAWGPSAAAGSYKLHCLDPLTKRWRLVATQVRAGGNWALQLATFSLTGIGSGWVHAGHLPAMLAVPVAMCVGTSKVSHLQFHTS